MRDFFAALLAATVFAEETDIDSATEPSEAGHDYSYKTNGSDWGDINSLCANGSE